MELSVCACGVPNSAQRFTTSSAKVLTEAIRRVYSSYTRENSLSSDLIYDGERSNVGGSGELFDVGGRVI